MKLIAWIIGIGTLGLVSLFFIGANYHPAPLADRVRSACQEQYTNEYAERNCEINLLVVAIDKEQADRLNQAKQDAGIR